MNPDINLVGNATADIGFVMPIGKCGKRWSGGVSYATLPFTITNNSRGRGVGLRRHRGIVGFYTIASTINDMSTISYLVTSFLGGDT